MWNPSVVSNKTWISKLLSEYGVDCIPMEMPFPIMQQFLLNADIILGLKGSKKGIELFCSVLSLGEVSIDDSNFYKDSQLLILNSSHYGSIIDSSDDKELYIVGDSNIINPAATLNVTINSKYFDGSYPSEATLIKNTIKTSIGSFMGFSPNKVINFTYGSRTSFYYHNLLNSYFR